MESAYGRLFRNFGWCSDWTTLKNELFLSNEILRHYIYLEINFQGNVVQEGDNNNEKDVDTKTCINTSRFYVRKIVIARIHTIREFTIRRDKIETAGFSNINVARAIRG